MCRFISNIILFSLVLLSSTSLSLHAQEGFLQQQLRNPRVRQAHSLRLQYLEEEYGMRELTWPPDRMLLRVFKKEKEVDVWVSSGDSLALFKTYGVCKMSGTPGPKRRQGDLQVPEGVYFIDRFNHASSFFLSLGLNYPNTSDLLHIKDDDPGGEIFIHGGCGSIGCVAMGEDNLDIMELYVQAVHAKEAGVDRIPVHIFPLRMEGGAYGGLCNAYIENDALLAFWKNLREVYLAFERSHQLPLVRVNEAGRYEVAKPVRR